MKDRDLFAPPTLAEDAEMLGESISGFFHNPNLNSHDELIGISSFSSEILQQTINFQKQAQAVLNKDRLSLKAKLDKN